MAQVPVDNSSGVAALRGDVTPVLPGIFVRPLHPLARIKSVTIIK
ncbi:hypothetical protein AB2G44_24770 (plasmid) [Escherichia coli]